MEVAVILWCGGPAQPHGMTLTTAWLRPQPYGMVVTVALW